MAVVEELNDPPLIQESENMFSPYLDLQVNGVGTSIERFFVNRAWDTVLEKFVLWVSTVTPDTVGNSYPHTWANATDYTFMEVCR